MDENKLDSRAIQHYERSEFHELVKLGDDVCERWCEEDAIIPKTLPPGIADMCFFVRNAHKKLGNASRQKLWEARTMTTAMLTDSPQTIARLLLAPFFACIEKDDAVLSPIDDPETGRQILTYMRALVPNKDDAWRPVIDRLYFENVAHSHQVNDQLEKAQENYEDALKASRHPGKSDPRGECKIQGSLASIHYLRALKINKDLSASIEEMNKVIVKAEENKWQDVVDIATENHRRMRDKLSELKIFALP